MAEISRISRAFKDISLSFQPHPVTGDLPVLKNERAIMRSVRNIVETIPGEKFFNPDFGSDVRSQLFELVDFGPAENVRIQIVESISAYEPRVNDLKVFVQPRPDTNEFEVVVNYNIIGQSFPTQTYTFILEATR
jgi:hypothetical protein